MRDIDSRLMDYSPEYQEHPTDESVKVKVVSTGYRIIYYCNGKEVYKDKSGRWCFKD